MKPKTCKVCKEKFVPVRSMQSICHPYDKPSCAAAYGMKASKKQDATRKRQERVETKKKRESMTTIPELKKELQRVFNARVREEDKDQGCISCGKPFDFTSGSLGGVMDAGHFRSVGSADHLRFDRRNVHGQCKRCNRYLGGNYAEYARRLPARIGQGAFDELMVDNAVIKWTREMLVEMIRHEKARLKELRGRG